MNFKQLYTDSKSQIAEAIIGMWKEASPKMVDRYGKQLDNIISRCISDNIVVENMAHWTPAVNDTEWRMIVNEKIWRKYNKEKTEIVKMGYPPYMHQYESWKALLEDNKSIVVTSGTGSGKTECFMVPLVHDLTKNQTVDDGRKEAVEAIFLYPLNALMEDQKERIDNYITFSERKLKFAVYNGNTPEKHSDDDEGFKNEIIARDKIRSEKPNILFTNPSMLEYMLLRKKDSALFTNELKWIVIDETHTYKGAAGAELAMLIRRILKACGTDATKVKFATSSATIGNDDAAKVELKDFISQITGQPEAQIEIIEGFRTEPKHIDECKKKLLSEKNFVLLKELLPKGTIEEKLELLDEWTKKENGLRIRLHYYMQALNQGLFIDPHNAQDSQFLLSRSIPLDDEGKLNIRYLDAYYCKECGAILGYGELDSNNVYSRIIKEEVAALEDDYTEDTDNDNDDSTTNSSTSSTEQTNEFYVGLFDEDANQNNQNSLLWTLKERKFNNSSSEEIKYQYKKIEKKDKRLIHHCPCCGAKGESKNKPMRTFRLSADFISRLIAPILLNQTTESTDNDVNSLPSKGRKYITFADSRQSVAGPTLKQNLETEEVWVTGVLYKELLKHMEPLSPEERTRLEKEKAKAVENENYQEADRIKKRLNPNRDFHLTWEKALDILHDDANCERMFIAFAKTNKANDNALGNLERCKAKKEYVLSALYRVMSRRLAFGKNCPENWGLICTYYPDLKVLRERTDLPSAIKEFNELIDDNDLKISHKDWYDYVKIFIDNYIRGNERFFFQRIDGATGWNEIDYSATRQFRTGVSDRRPIDGEKNKIEVGNNRHTKLLLNLLNKKLDTELTSIERDRLEAVIEQLKNDLIICHIKEEGKELNWEYDRNRKTWLLNGWKTTEIERTIYHYMNLSRIAFKLYDDKVWFDHNLRIPVDTTFKGYSPASDKILSQYKTKCKEESWTPYVKEAGVKSRDWFETHRGLIKHKWTSKLERILDYSSNDPNTLYIQAEHTAQVARSLIKEQTDKFKRGDINIMACSTTMEMGVDLGDLELVVMNNVPPHPANYKQRAGRAGRGDQNKSTAVTICGCDASGEALMSNPLTSLICAPIEPPKVNLKKSPQLVQRHINSFLFRKYISDGNVKFSPGGEGENDRGYKVSDLFTKYRGVETRPWGNIWIAQVMVDENTFIWPSKYESLIKDNGSHYSRFLAKLDEYSSDDNVLEEIRELADGALDDAVTLIQNTKKKIQHIAEAIDNELNEIKNQWDSVGCDPNRPSGKDNPWKSWNYRFTSILNTNLLSYLSTHQFTPNANMPVGIVEMVIDDSEKHTTENPSRDMKTAISEYAPGRKVFINGTTFLMGGVRWNSAQSNIWLKKCCNNHTWLETYDNCPKCQQPPVEWGEGFGKYIEVMTPTGFYPHKETSRITQKETMDLVLDTALIGVGNWTSQGDERLYMTRTNEDDVDSQIFYYNKGLGHGYYVCKECGYAVPAPNASLEKEILRKTLFPIENRKNKKESYHNYRGWKCTNLESDNLDKKVYKNIVFGGAIQTDYCEIVLFDDASHPMPYDQETGQIAFTLGVMMCREFTNRIACERSEVDFIVRRQDGKVSICIFDTAKGGNGYSKRLKEGHLLDSILDTIRKKLMNCKRADMILDRTTMKYADKINVHKTSEWLEREYLFRKIVSQEIKDLLPNREIRVSSYQDVENAIKGVQTGEHCSLFFNGEYINRDWNFCVGDVNWRNNRGGLNETYPQQKVFAAYNMPTAITSYDEVKMILSSRGVAWKAAENPLGQLFPIAQIGRTLYFTDERQYTALNGRWAVGNVYSVDYDNIPLSNLVYITIGNEHYKYPAGMECYSDELFKKLYDNSDKLREYIKACRGHNLSFTYHEEYLRTHLGMTIVLQFIMKFAKEANAKIKLIEIIGEEYDDSHLHSRRPKSYDWNTSQPRYLQVNCLDNDLRDGYLEDKFLKDLYPKEVEYYSIESREEGKLPHWRSLIVTDSDTGAVIEILPNGGFANGWIFNDGKTRPGGYFNDNCDINTQIPIKNIDSNGLLYDIKIKE